MTAALVDEMELRRALKALAKVDGSMDVGWRAGCSIFAIEDMISGILPISQGVVNLLGYRRVVKFEKISDPVPPDAG